MMRRMVLSVLLVLAACGAALSQANVDASRKELNAGARAYREGRYKDAEEHFRRAHELDPRSKNARLYMARAIQQQYKPGVEDPENVMAGERAAEAYREILSADPLSEDAYKAIIVIYTQMKSEDKVRETILQRANNFALTNDARADAFLSLANRFWQCSYDLTERKENKKTSETPSGPVILYTMPADASDFLRARQCVSEGLQFADQAVMLNQDAAHGWSLKANLLREAVKLAEMEGDTIQKAEYERQHAEAGEHLKRLGVAPAAVQTARRPQTGGASVEAPNPPKGAVVSGGVLNGKAVSKPAPAYPDVAKAARAQGTVTVQILVDEDGNVASARAISGHPLLQQAAVEAARRAKFSPTFLNGQPVKVTGSVTYNFVLQ